MAELLADTDVFVDHLRGERRLQPGGDAISYSVITRAELFADAAAQEERVDRLLSAFRELDIGREVAELAGRLRRERGVLVRDALIAATAVSHGLSLLTRNVGDFESVPDLQLVESSAR